MGRRAVTAAFGVATAHGKLLGSGADYNQMLADFEKNMDEFAGRKPLGNGKPIFESRYVSRNQWSSRPALPASPQKSAAGNTFGFLRCA